MWHCVISGGVIACQSARNCFKYYNLWYAVRFAWCYWEKISKFNIFHFLPASAVSVSDNFSSPHGDSRWGRDKWLEVTVEVRDLFPWEIFTKMVISCLLNVEKNLKLCANKLKLDLKLLPKICFRRNNIYWEIDPWNRRRFGAKWHVTVPNSVASVKPIVCKLIYISQGLCCQVTHKLHVC